MQLEGMHIHLYRALSLGDTQKQAVIDLLRDWQRRRDTLDGRAAAACADLERAAPQTLVTASRLISSAIGRGLAPAEDPQAHYDPAEPYLGAAPVECRGRSVTESPPSPPNPAQPRGFAGQGEIWIDWSAEGFMIPEDFGDDCASAVWQAQPVPPGLQGQCPAATTAVAVASQETHATHADSARQLLDFAASTMLPGEVLRTEQLMRVVWEPIRAGCGPVDWLELCMHAVQQRRRQAVFSGVEPLAL